MLGKDKYRLVLAQPDLDWAVVGKPPIAPTNFVANEDANAIQTKKAAHKILWREYQMQEAINKIGVKKIVGAIDAQYIKQLEAEYVGYTGITIFTMLKYLRTW